MLTLASALSKGGYYGRGILVGRIRQGGDLLILYFLTGRSETSRKRRFEMAVTDKGVVIKVIYCGDAKITDEKRALIEYDAIVLRYDCVCVSNGRHTNSIMAYQAGDADTRLRAGLSAWDPEDDPHNTPRIAMLYDFDTYRINMGIVRKDIKGGIDRSFFKFKCSPGTGCLMTTYQGTITAPPLPPFFGSPIKVRIPWNDVASAGRALFHRGDPNMIGVVAMTINPINVRTLILQDFSGGTPEYYVDRRP